MLRVEFNRGDHGLIVQLSGRLVGAYAEGARIALSQSELPPSIVVDLCEMSFVDSFGEQVLLWLARRGARFIADNVYTRGVCEHLQLRISEKPHGFVPGADTKVLP